MVHCLQSGDGLNKACSVQGIYEKYFTAKIYARELQVLFPNFDWNKAGVDISDMDEDKLSFHMQDSWKAFVDKSMCIGVQCFVMHVIKNILFY